MTAKPIHVIDTDYLLAFLNVPGYDRAGPHAISITTEIASAEISAILVGSGTIVLPTAVIIEAGNHIAQSVHSVRDAAHRFGEIIHDSIDSKAPWACYDETMHLDNHGFLKSLVAEWVTEAEHRVSIGDMAIRQVVGRYVSVGSHVTILTGD